MFSCQVIMATNRADTLDPALLRPGRLDRKIEFPLPDRRQKRLVFSTITSKMNLSEEVDLEDCILIMPNLQQSLITCVLMDAGVYCTSNIMQSFPAQNKFCVQFIECACKFSLNIYLLDYPSDLEQ